ncbi:MULTISPECIES: MFS transporter [unclassified Streptomyces]|uniref:MFS transporter n=1 Tax=unclassified Streptomyces TaxID=2593676 RepID=UPI002481B7CF|nr:MULTISPECIES: MFS transporter [unclassified Streptomyces]MDA5280861.1 MFS transporter [Streptomyces sp. Isolate_45]MDX2390647.1 MFS transporter [Streptomyces sp. DK15]
MTAPGAQANRLKRTFEALSVRNFRLFAGGQLLSVTCTWMMIVAQDWLVLSLSGDSGTALGLVTALQFTPVLLLTLMGGRLADRYDKRVLLICANAASGVLSLLFALAVLLPGAELWHVYLFALGLGTVNAVEVPTRLSFISEMVGAELLPNASALSAAYFNAARVVGPALAGLLISVLGTGPVIALNAVSYLATVLSLLAMRPGELQRGGAPQRGATRVADGLAYVRGRPDLLLPMALVGVVGMFGFNFQLTLPLLAKTVFHADPRAFGLLASALAAGSLLAAFVTTARRGRPTATLVVASAIAFGLLETLTGLAPTFATALVLLAATGFASMTFAQATNHRIQLGSDPRFRGRVMALYALIMQGTTPVGALLLGWLAEHWGARSGLYVGGLVSLAAALAVLFVQLRGTGDGAPPDEDIRANRPEVPDHR